MSKVEVWHSLPTFEIYPKKTFFGIDKNKAHTFKLPKEMTQGVMEKLNLGGEKLQSKIRIKIGERIYPAIARVWRGNRDRLRKLKREDLPERLGIMFTWVSYEVTIAAVKVALQDAFEQITNAGINTKEAATFIHVKNELFILQPSHNDTL